MKAKILLINPLSTAGKQTVFSVGIAYLSAYLDLNKISISVFDRNACLYMQNRDIDSCNRLMISQVKEYAPDYVGFSMMSTNFSDVSFCANQLKELFPDIKIIVGGIHPTYEFTRTMAQIPEVDVLVRGPGEIALQQILEGTQLESIPNLVYRHDGALKHTQCSPMKRREELVIDYKRFGFDQYWINHAELINVLDVFDHPAVLITQQGCPGACIFCLDDRYKGQGFYHSTDFVLDEMVRLKNEYGRNSFLFYDRVFRGSPKKAMEFCKRKIERDMAKISWGASFRTDFLTEELVWWLKESGCIFVAAGLEAATQPMLDFLNKGITVEQNVNAFSLLFKNHLLFLGSFIYGLPGQREADLQENIKFFDAFPFADSGISQIAPFPGSKLYDNLIAEKKINPDDPSYWELVKSFEKPVPELNFSEMSDDRYVTLFHEHANYIYDKCKTNRSRLIKEMNSRH